MWIIDGWMFLGLCGIPYLTFIIISLAVTGRFRNFVVPLRHLSALVLPLALYLFMTFAVQDRQGFNWGYANLAMAVPGMLAVIMATRSSFAYWCCIAITGAAGITAWLIIPMKGLTRLF